MGGKMELKMALVKGLIVVIVILAVAGGIMILNLPDSQAAGEGGGGLSITPSPLPNPTGELQSFRNQLIKNNKLQDSAFAALPNMPLDFLAVKSKFEVGQLPISRVTSAYYLQPEWYMGWEDNQKRYLEPLIYGYSFNAGYGAYPSEYIALAKRNDELKVSFIAVSDFISNMWQGISIQPDYLADVEMRANYYPDNSRGVRQNISYVKEHIKVVSITPSEFTLEPARNWQAYEWNAEGQMIKAYKIPDSFEYGWAKMVTITFKTMDLEAGKYAIVFRFGSPSDEYSLEKASKYLNRYKEAESSISTGWQFGVFFQVE